MASGQGNKVLGISELSFCPYFSAHGLLRDTRIVSRLCAQAGKRGRRRAGSICPGVRRAGCWHGGSAGLRLSLPRGPESERTRPSLPRSREGRSRASSEFLVLVPQGGEVTMSTPPSPRSSLPATSLPRSSPARFLIHTIRSWISHRQMDISYLGFRWAWV